MAEKVEEELPVSDFYKVIDHVTVFKSQKWWKAIVVFESGGRRVIGMYLWVNREGVWKRKHKFDVWSLDEWNKLKAAVEQLVPKLVAK